MDLPDLLRLVQRHAELFRSDFARWLEQNSHVWREFESRALRVTKRRSHYAARTIWEVIRFETDVSETASQYKLNNNFVPDCARLFGLTHPALKDFFETRLKPSALRSA